MLKYIILTISSLLLLASCVIPDEELFGVYYNKFENTTIELKPDSTYIYRGYKHDMLTFENKGKFSLHYSKESGKELHLFDWKDLDGETSITLCRLRLGELSFNDDTPGESNYFKNK